MRLLFLFFWGAVFASAQAQTKQVDSIRQVIDTSNGEVKAQAYYDLISTYTRIDLKKAKATLQEAEVFFNGNENLITRTYSLLSRASYLANVGVLDSAELYYSKSVMQSEQLANKDLELVSLNGYAYVTIMNGKPKLGIESILKGLKLVSTKTQRIKWVPRFYSNLTWAYLELKQYNDCIKAGHEALPKLTFNAISRTIIGGNMAASFAALQNLDSTLFYVNYVITQAKPLAANQQIANAYFIAGDAYANKNKLEQALSQYLKAKPYRELAENPFFIASDLYTLSKLYGKMGRYKEGVATGLQALDIIQKHNMTLKFENSYLSLADNYSGLNDYRNASKFYRLWAIAKDSTYKNANANAMAEMRTKYETEKRELELAESKIVLTETNLRIQHRNNQLIIAGSIIILLILAVIVFYRSQKAKQDRLRIEADLKAQLAEVEAKNALQLERLRISRELHDNIGSQLTFINSSIDANESSSKMEEVKKLTLDTIRELRKTVWLVNQSSVTLEEFVVKLREYLNQGTSTAIKVNAFGNLQRELSSNIATNVFRVIQEAVNNAIKHAQATQLCVSVECHDKQLMVSITDNGKGFVQEQITAGYGLKNMAERISSIGGLFEVKSKPGEGTTVVLQIS